MLAVTVGAGGRIRDAQLERLAVDARQVFIRDLLVASAAGLRDPPPMNAALGVGGAAQVVCAVAVGAGGRLQVPLADPFGVRGAGVAFEDVGQKDLPVLQAVHAVAFSAQLGFVGLVGGRVGIAGRQHVVHAVAAGASGRRPFPQRGGLGVDAPRVIGRHLLVAGRAVGRRQLLRMGEIGNALQAGVAVHARHARLAVDGGLVLFRVHGVVALEARRGVRQGQSATRNPKRRQRQQPAEFHNDVSSIGVLYSDVKIIFHLDWTRNPQFDLGR